MIARSACRPSDPNKIDSILALHHTAQRLLQPYDVIVPFAPDLNDFLPVERVEVRRTFGHLISLIQAVALLYQFQREVNDTGQLIATLDDYEIVRAYLAEPLARSLGCALTPAAKRLLGHARELGSFSVRDLVGGASGCENTVRSRIMELEGAGQVRVIEEGKGRKPTRYATLENPPSVAGLSLPDLRRRNYPSTQTTQQSVEVNT
jgi:hypothetical protein